MSIIHKFEGKTEKGEYQWEGVQANQFSLPDNSNYIKHILIGSDDGAPTFVIRFFQLPVGSSSPLHKHPHEHGVLILRGKARVQINDDFQELSIMDTVFISGEDLHQFVNIGNESLGFLCVVPKSGEY
ncbi:MAG: cupin domain-containing protein [Anaerolineaceae bacterium]|nr:cupin domain-containing protein [Anaerolineaceae bacterium]